LGLSSIEPVDPILPWIQKPLQTNTYTGMYPFFKDFGIFGVALFSIVLGLVYGWFYKKAKSLKTFSVLAYSYFVTVMISQYVGDMFVTNLTGHIKFLCVLVFPFVCTKYGVFKIKKRG
jgi:oligosaccharide repeat unit polymerase